MRPQARLLIGTAAVTALALTLPLRGQIRYSSGQNAAPIFEGWQRHADGSIDMVFGYLNRNFEEELDIPIGEHNRCEPAPVDCGQPTHFLTRRHRFVFTVRLPKDWPKDRRLLWMLTSKGRTDTASGTLHPDMEIDYGVMSENINGGTLAEGNTPPRLVTASGPQTVVLPTTATVSVTFDDDGLPKPRPRPASSSAPAAPPEEVSPEVLEARRNRQPGIRIRWVHYRGPGTVKFDPASVPPVHGRPIELTSRAVFSAPGTYVLRAVASDSQLESAHDVIVTVQAAAR
jgi:hypothetical protein